MNNGRISSIDFLRAVAIIIVGVTHVLSYNLGSTTVNVTWNYLHFVVPLLIFCSGYVTYIKHHDTPWDMKKRISRLLIPYYGYTLLNIGVLALFGRPLPMNILIKSVFLIGVDYGWLPLLFVEMGLLTPILLTVSKSQKATAGVFILSILSSTALALYGTPAIDYRLVMWIPWSSILLLSFMAAKMRLMETLSRHTSLLAVTAFSSFVIFLLFSWYLTTVHRALTLTLHKYPPDILYLSYSVGMGVLLVSISMTANIYSTSLRRALEWVSKHSYSLFFLHYAFLTMLPLIKDTIGIPAQILFVLAGTTLAFLLIQTTGSLLGQTKKRTGPALN